MSTQRRCQVTRIYPLRPAPTRLRQRSWTWPPLSDVAGYLFSIAAILWLGAAVARFAEVGR